MATIEELKEAREALTTEEGYAAGCRCKYCKAVDAVLPLIDAEIERQGVTDEDVAEAIEWLDEDRRNLERKVAQTSSFNAGILRRELNRVRLAIQALQAYRPEREACEWCRNVNNTHKMLFKMYGENYDPFLNRNGMSGNEHNVGYAYIDGCTIRYSAPQGEISWNLGIIYCPMCGRYLREAEESE